MEDDREQLIVIDQQQQQMNIESVDAEMESVEGSAEQSKQARRKGQSMTSVCPSMILSWHGITAKPRHQKSLIPFMSTLRGLSNSRSGGKDPRVDPSQKVILNKVYGAAHPGEVLALMGASGAGKTSLLNILTQRNLSTLRHSGHICLNGTDIDRHWLRRISAYIQQEDLFIGTMTVLEHLRFMALLRMGKHYSRAERERRVQNVINELGLKHCANTVIGWPHRLKGLSGGERKRLAFASEIMTGPPILFCDEPTSGLDSYLAQQVIQVLKDLARRKNMTIVVTIHQPSSQVFEMFDKICLLTNGQLTFLGTINEAVTFFDGLGYKLPENFNPADHFISILAMEVGRIKQSKARIDQICKAFSDSDVGRNLLELAGGSASSSTTNGGASADGTVSPASSTSSSSSLSTSVQANGLMLGIGQMGTESYRERTLQRYKSTWCQQFWALTKRSFFVTLREPMLLKVRLFQTLLIGLLLGSIYWQTKIQQSTVMNINGLIFQAVANMNFMFQFAAIYVFCDEFPILFREHLANLYRIDAYFLAKNVAESLQYVIYPVLFATIVYWMAGFVREFDAYLLFTLSCLFITNVAVSLAYATACICGTVDVATAILPVIVVPLLAFGGFYINQESLPPYFYWLKYLSYFGYAYEAAAINQWMRVDHIDGCASSNQSSHVNSGGVITCDPLNCCQNGTVVLDNLSFDQSHMWRDFLLMAVMIVVLRIVAFLALWIRSLTKK